jgi:predicted O-methyltransferase YrrM
MNQEQWTAVDRYFAEAMLAPDPALDAARARSAEAGLPPISVSPLQGKLLHVLARAIGARNILELGTLGGYSTIWLARALPSGGHLTTLEIDPKHAEIARRNIADAGLAQVVELRLGPALEILPQLAAEKRGPFDLIFIDADKTGVPDYFGWSLKLSRPGTLIIVDNVVRRGAVTDAQSEEPGIRGLRRFNELVAREPRVSATAIQTVGSKGWDGFAVLVVLNDR